MRRVELFEAIREDHRQGASIRSLAERYAVHRRTVRQAIACAVPPTRQVPERPRPALTNDARAFIDEVLETDAKAPRKQRHTARRIHQRLIEKREEVAAESTIRAYVAGRRRELGRVQAFVPQHHPLGKQAEADFYEAVVVFPSGPVTAKIITLRSSASAKSSHVAYPSETQAAMFEGLARGLEFLVGCLR